MKRTAKSILSIIFGFALTLAMFFCACIIFSPRSVAKADGPSDFYIYGASIRAKETESETDGIRFHILISDSFYNTHYLKDNVYNPDYDIYVKLMSKNLLEDGKTVLTTAKTSKVITAQLEGVWIESELVSGYREAMAYVYGSFAGHYADDLAIAAVAVEKGAGASATPVYETAQATGSLAYVAWQSGDSTFDTYLPQCVVQFNSTNTDPTLDSALTTVIYGTDLSTVAPTRTGYAIENMYNDSGFSSAVTEGTYVLGNSSVYIDWTPTYTVTDVSGKKAQVFADTVGVGSEYADSDADNAYNIVPGWSADAPSGVEGSAMSYSVKSGNVSVSDAGAVSAGSAGAGDTAVITIASTDADTGKPVSCDITINVYGYYEINTEAGFDAIPAQSNNYYRMTSDIALTGTHNNAKSFYGIFDGNGKEITGLELDAGNRGLFNNLVDATIKDLNIIDAKLMSSSGNYSGALAYGAIGATVIDNVYVSVRDYGVGKIGGLLGRVWDRGGLEVKNSCVYLPVMGYTTDSRTNGFVAGEITFHTTISNCVFIGGNGQDRGYLAEAYDSVPTITDTIICSALEAHKTYSSALTDLGLYSVYNANHPYLALNNENFKKKTFDSLTTEIVDLTESITAAGELNLETKTFTGVFEGNGKSITGLKILGKPLLGNLAGATIRNVVIIDAELTDQNQGVLAYSTASGTGTTNIFDNVYISLKAVRKGGNGTGAMIDRGWEPIVFKDVVIYVDADLNNLADVSFVQGSNCAPTIITINCTFIGTVNYTKGKANDGKIVLDADTVKCKKSEVTDDVLAKMSDQNYEAYTGTPRA